MLDLTDPHSYKDDCEGRFFLNLAVPVSRVLPFSLMNEFSLSSYSTISSACRLISTKNVHLK